MIEQINSDTEQNVNPFKGMNTGPFIARAARVKWATALGRNSIELRTNDHRDTRHVTTHQGDPLYNAMTSADSYLADYPDFKDRALLPVWKICLDHQQHVVSFEAMPLSHEEQIRADVQCTFDELHALGRQHGIAWGTVDNLCRDCQRLYTEDWSDKAKENITAYAASVQSKKVLESIAFHKNQFDYWWRGDTNVYPFDTRTVSDLDAWFGPKEKPVSDKPTTLEDYFKDDKVRKNFWTSARDICKSNGIEDSRLQDEHIHEVLVGGTGASVKDFQGNAGAALKIIADSFDMKTKHTELPADNAQKAADLAPALVEAPMTPATANESPADKSEPQPALISSTIPETPFVVLFTLYSPGGLEMKYTVRAMSAAALESQADDLIKRLIKKGYTTRRMAEVTGQAAAQNGGSTAPTSADKGTSPCMLIKCVKSYQAQKPQLEIEVDGFEKPFRFTQEKWEQLTKVLKGHKPNGAEFTAGDMGEGKKYAGNWVVDWEKKTKDDKTFWNVLAVRDAA